VRLNWHNGGRPWEARTDESDDDAVLRAVFGEIARIAVVVITLGSSSLDQPLA
jgi:hypothetical protein